MLSVIYDFILIVPMIVLFYAFCFAIKSYGKAYNPRERNVYFIISLLDLAGMLGIAVEVISWT